jgi:phosphate transport system substrate-binding protein
MSIKWPAGTGEAGSAAVAERIKNTRGALGYLQLGYALGDNIGAGLVKNRAGTLVKADSASVTAAARSCLSEVPPDLRFSLTDAKGADAYPIASAVWAIVYIKQQPGKRALVDFLRWSTHNGQQFAEELHHARLPNELVERIDRKLDQIAPGLDRQ